MNSMVRVAGIVQESIVDGPGIRFVIFTQGCRHNCQGCHNMHTHSFNNGKLISIESIISKVKENPLLDGVTLSGGEPFEQANVLSSLSMELKKLGHNIITYSGYTYEYLVENSEKMKGWTELLQHTDILIDGRFEIEKINLNLRFRGSENQRAIDVRKTELNKKIILAEWDYAL